VLKNKFKSKVKVSNNKVVVEFFMSIYLFKYVSKILS
jgi:hypothetical protein